MGKLKITKDDFAKTGKTQDEDYCKYKHVERFTISETGKIIYKAVLRNIGEFGSWIQLFSDDRSAAKAVDWKLAKLGRKPVNGTIRRINL